MMNSKMEKKRKSNINSELSLPLELIKLILSKLPFVNLPSCRLVCKAWNNLILTCKFDLPISISNLFFAHISPFRKLHCVDFDPKHLEGMSSVASFSFHPNLSSTNISIINSCNGFLCCFFDHGPTKTPACEEVEVCILNPVMNEYFKPPISNADRGIRRYHYGLGFSPKTKNYKLVRLSFAYDKFAILVEIFAFGTNCKWTLVGFVPPFVGSESHGVYFNGGLYWVGNHLRVPYTKVIYRLDVEDEKFKFQEICIPHHGEGRSCLIEVFNGNLYITLFILNFGYHVWKMEEDFSWTKAFDVLIPEQLHPCNLQPIKACEDGKLLCLLAGLYLILYNPNTKRMELLTHQDFDIKKVHRIDSFSFDSIHKILAGDARRQ